MGVRVFRRKRLAPENPSKGLISCKTNSSQCGCHDATSLQLADFVHFSNVPGDKT